MIVVQYVLDTLPRIVGALETAKVDRPEDSSKIKETLLNLNGIVPDCEPGKETGECVTSMIVGNLEYTKSKSGKKWKWNDGRELKDQYDPEACMNIRTAQQDANLDTPYNMDSVMKRVTMAQTFAELLDESIYM